MLLGPVMGRAYLGGAAVWGAIMAVQGAGAIAAGLLCLGRRPQRPMVIATVGTFCYALPDIPMAVHAAVPWVAAAALCCGAGSAVFSTFEGTTMQQQIPPERLARVSSLSLFPAYCVGVIGYAVMLAIPSVREVRWHDRAPQPQNRVTAGCEPRPAERRTRPAARPR